MTAAGAPRFARDPSEQDLVARAQAGDHDAIEALFDKYQSPIFNHIYRTMGDAEDAYDLTQDTFLKAYLALAKTSDDLKVSAWLYRIATNVCLDELRHRRLVKWQPWDAFLSVFHPSQVAKDSPERDTIDREDAEEVQAILDKLPPRYREYLILREYLDLSYNEIAAIHHTTRATVKSILFRAREQFRRLYAVSDRQPGRARTVEDAPLRDGRPADAPKTWGVAFDRNWHRKPWRAEPWDTAARSTVYLGRFDTAEAAQATVNAWLARRAAA